MCGCTCGVGNQNQARDIQRQAQQQIQNMMAEMNSFAPKQKLNNLDNPLNPQNQADTMEKPNAKKPNKVATPNAVDQKAKAGLMNSISEKISNMVESLRKQMVSGANEMMESRTPVSARPAKPV